MVVHVAQLTDLHVVASSSDETLYADNNARVRDAVASILAETPRIDAVLATGDLVQWGVAEEYEMLAELLEPMDVPVLPLPGNHDDRALLLQCFPEYPSQTGTSASAGPDGRIGHLSWAVDVAGVRIIGLDTTKPGEPGAEFDDERAEWLSQVLAESHDGPTLLAMHHPPFPSGIEWMDRSGFVGLERFEQVMRDAGTVDRIVCGHLHRPMTSVAGGVVAEVGPATAVHVALDLTPGAGPRIVRDPIGYRIFRISDRSIVGHTRWIGTGEEPLVPAWADEM